VSRERLQWSEEPGAGKDDPATRNDLLRELGDSVRANQRATDTIDEIASQLLGVNRTDGRCLDILEQHGRMSAGHLARESGLTTGAITAVVDRLERAGYVHRLPDPHDRRRVLVELTPRAIQAAEELFGPLAEGAAPSLADYSDEDLRMLIEFHRVGREVQERHAEALRRRLRERKGGADVTER
jgi:DNA-binding MarR family transcriptional regulator